MKKQLLALAFVVCYVININAQQKTEPAFTADKLTFKHGSKTLTYLGNVSVKDDVIHVKNAEKIVYNRKTNKITAYNFEECNIKGSLTIPDPNKKCNVLEYTLGQTVAYVK